MRRLFGDFVSPGADINDEWAVAFLCSAVLPSASKRQRAHLPQGFTAGLGGKGASMLMRTPHRWVRPKRLQPPGFIVPCQPTPANEVPVGDGWIHELKHDGFRIVAFKEGDTVRLWSRNGRDWCAEFLAISGLSHRCPMHRRHDWSTLGPSSQTCAGVA